MGVLPWGKVNAQRKFIDLINEATFKWANWDPPKVIQVSPSSPIIAVHRSAQVPTSHLLQIGDFGVIDKKTGELKIEGNIFTHPETKHVAQDFPAYVAPETDLYQIHSEQVKRLDVKADEGA